MLRRPPRSTLSSSSAASDVYKRQVQGVCFGAGCCAGCWDGANAGFGQVESSLVLGADGGVEQVPVAQAHFGGGVTEDGHQGLQGHAGVHEGGGVGVSELVSGDVSEPSCGGGAIEFLAEPVLAHSVAV